MSPILIMCSAALSRYSLQWEWPDWVMFSGMCIDLMMFSMLWACWQNWILSDIRSAIVWLSLSVALVAWECPQSSDTGEGMLGAW